MYERDLARSLADLADALVMRGHGDAAVAAGDESIRIRRELAEAHSFLVHEYLDALSRDAAVKAAVGQWAAAARELGEAVVGCYQRARSDRSRFAPGLGIAVYRLRALITAAFDECGGADTDAVEEIRLSLRALDDAATSSDVVANPALAIFELDRGALSGLVEEFPGVFTPDLERCDGAVAAVAAGEGAAREVGCASCWGDDANAVKDDRHARDSYALLAEDSHFLAGVLRCSVCAQLFANVFMEVVDWRDGEDEQYSRLVPISRAEADELIGGRLSVFRIGELAAGRRHLRSDWPSGIPRPRVFWADLAFPVSDES